MKLCRDCKFFQNGDCIRIENTEVNYITGGIIYKFTPQDFRNNDWKSVESCGRDGKFFEEIAK